MSFFNKEKLSVKSVFAKFTADLTEVVKEQEIIFNTANAAQVAFEKKAKAEDVKAVVALEEKKSALSAIDNIGELLGIKTKG